MSTQTTTTRRSQLRLRKEFIIVLLLLIPLCATIVAIAPMPAEFTTRGEFVHVAEIGIDGSVYITYVESGVTRNLYERFYTWFYYARQGDSEGIEFIPISDDYLEYIEDEEAYGVAMLVDTVEQAVTAVNTMTDNTVDELSEIDERVDYLLSELADFYGDSLGLMIAIGLYEEEHGIWFADELGINIAGTGAMEYGGTVGTIGALKQKLLGAEMRGIDLYFIPDDYELYEQFSNVAEAIQVKEEYDLSLDIVPVSTLQEAIEYLILGSWESL